LEQQALTELVVSMVFLAQQACQEREANLDQLELLELPVKMELLDQ